MAPAAGAARGRHEGVRIIGAAPVLRTTADLNGPSEIYRLPRLQPTEHEEELPQKRPLPGADARADGVSRAQPGSRLSFGDTSLAFDGPSLADSAPAYPPDTMGDIGPTQFLAMINGRVRTYDKATGLADDVMNTDTETFWAAVKTPPTANNFTSDPRVRYDRLSGRWFLTMIDVPGMTGSQANRIMLAVSSAGTITPSTTWAFYKIDAPAGEFADYETLGVDANALYIGTNQFSLTGAFLGTDGYVIRKSALLAAGPSLVATRFDLVTAPSGGGPYTPQGVDNPNPSAAAGYFVGVDNLAYSLLDVRRVTDPGGTPVLSGDLGVGVPATSAPLNVPHPNQSKPLDAIDDRLFAAQMRNGRIWTAHNIRVDVNGAAGSGGTRTASRWYEINVTGTPALAQSGTVFDPSLTNPRSYWMPTVAANGQGAMAIGGSVSGLTTPPNAWYSGRLASAAVGTSDAPVTYSTGTADYNVGGGGGSWRWGDYSQVRVDPDDDQTFWVMQEYVNGLNSYGTRIIRLRAPGPTTPASTSESVPRRRASTTVEITGAAVGGLGFFDPGTGFAHRISASVGCAGVAINGIIYTSPTRVTLDLDTTSAAETTCPVTITNPDGQSATSATPILTVGLAPVAADDAATVAQDAMLSGASVLANDTDADGDVLSAVSPTTPAHGSVTLNPDGTYTYTPVAGFSGSDAFTYRASDGVRLSDLATVSITVTPTPTPTPPAPTGGTTSTAPGSSGSGSGSGAGSGSGSGPGSGPSATASCKVPYLIGLRLAKARRRVANRGCRLGKVTRRRAHRGKHRRIIRASRKPGKVLPAGTRIRVTVRR